MKYLLINKLARLARELKEHFCKLIKVHYADSVLKNLPIKLICQNKLKNKK